MSMTRTVRIVAVCVAVIVCMSLCVWAQTKIEVWVGHDSWVPYLLHFNEIQDEYEIEYLIQGSTDALLAAVAAGTPPDVFRTGPMLDLAARGVLMPLDPFIQRDGVDLAPFIPGILRSLQWDGTTYALPLNGDSNLVFYNQDKFEEAGLDAAWVPQDWADLEAAARRLNRTDGEGLLQQLGFSWWAKSVQFTLFLHQTLDGIFTPDLSDIAFDTRETFDVINWIVDSQNAINGGQARVEELFERYGGGSSHDAFVGGGLVMDTSAPAQIARTVTEAPDMRFGVFPLPVAPGGRRVSLSGGHRVTIPVGAKNPEGAWAFIKWLTSKEAGLEFAEPGFTQRYIDRAYQGIGQSMSARIDVNLEAPFYRDTPLWRDFAQDMVYAIEHPIHPLHPEIITILQDNTLRVLHQEISPGESLELSAHEARSRLAEWAQ